MTVSYADEKTHYENRQNKAPSIEKIVYKTSDVSGEQHMQPPSTGHHSFAENWVCAYT